MFHGVELDKTTPIRSAEHAFVSFTAYPLPIPEQPVGISTCTSRFTDVGGLQNQNAIPASYTLHYLHAFDSGLRGPSDQKISVSGSLGGHDRLMLVGLACQLHYA